MKSAGLYTKLKLAWLNLKLLLFIPLPLHQFACIFSTDVLNAILLGIYIFQNIFS